MLTGLETKKIIKSMDLSIGRICEELGMTRQNLYRHTTKDVISESFYRLLKDKFPNHFKQEQPIQQINNVTSNPIQKMSTENHNYLVELMKEKLDRISQQLSECQEELSTYKEVKPNAKHGSSK